MIITELAELKLDTYEISLFLEILKIKEIESTQRWQLQGGIARYRAIEVPREDLIRFAEKSTVRTVLRAPDRRKITSLVKSVDHILINDQEFLEIEFDPIAISIFKRMYV